MPIGLATGFLILLATRAALGLSEGSTFPALSGAISYCLSPHMRARAVGHSLAAIPISLAIEAPARVAVAGDLTLNEAPLTLLFGRGRI